MSSDVVQGFIYVGNDEHRVLNICKLIARADVSDLQLRDEGPAFTVEFGDGHQMTAYAHELNPWYPVD